MNRKNEQAARNLPNNTIPFRRPGQFQTHGEFQNLRAIRAFFLADSLLVGLALPVAILTSRNTAISKDMIYPSVGILLVIGLAMAGAWYFFTKHRLKFTVDQRFLRVQGPFLNLELTYDDIREFRHTQNLFELTTQDTKYRWKVDNATDLVAALNVLKESVEPFQKMRVAA